MEESKHTRIKKNIEEAYNFFEDNIKRHKQSTRFAFKQTLTPEEAEVLEITQKPPIEINYIQAYLSRLLGEFYKQKLEVVVSGNDTGEKINVATVDLVWGIMRDIFDQYDKRGDPNQVRKDQCGGSYSVLKCGAEYKNTTSFEQVLTLRKAKDCLMCFFDPKSKLPSKSDGLFCGENYPMTLKEFKKEYPKFSQKADNLNYGLIPGQNFSWSYRNMSEDIVILSDYYQVEYDRYTLARLSDGSSMRESEYNKMKKDWGENNIEPIPDIVKRRPIKDKKIKRYVIFGEDIIEEEDTPYPELPYIFVDGDSAFVYRNDTGGEIEQVVHSYIHNAMDAQRVLNYTAQTVANYSENLMQQRYILEERSLVNEDDWINPQRASLLLYKSQDGEGNQIPPPQPVVQAGLPDSIMHTLVSMQHIIESTFGVSYSSSRGVGQEIPSGVAMDKGETQNNATAMPFKIGYIDAINAAAKFHLKMIPRVHITPMTIPFIDKEGERKFVKINQLLQDGTKDPESLHIDYDKDDDILDVKVKSGDSFEMQQDKSLNTMIQLMRELPSFKMLIDSPEGLPVVIEELDTRNKDKLIEMAKQNKEKQSQKQNQPNPAQQQAMIQQQELQLKKQKMQMDFQQSQAEFQMKEKQLNNDLKIAMINLEKEAMNDAVQNEKVQAEINNSKITSAGKIADQILKERIHEHDQLMDISNMHK